MSGRITHGETNTRLWKAWAAMKFRGSSKFRPKRLLKYYKAGMDIRWMDYLNFKKDMRGSFLDHVKQHGEHETTLDRKNSNLPYSKNNCRWATFRQQGQNRRCVEIIIIDGISGTIPEWCVKYKISMTGVRDRIKKGWSKKKAITTPPMSFIEAGKISGAARRAKKVVYFRRPS